MYKEKYGINEDTLFKLTEVNWQKNKENKKQMFFTFSNFELHVDIIVNENFIYDRQGLHSEYTTNELVRFKDLENYVIDAYNATGE